MTRAAAREMAIQLCFYRALNPGDTQQALEFFFEKDYYNTLKNETVTFLDYPNGKQLEYIRGIVIGVEEHREEIDEIIKTYSRGWKVSRISKTALAVLRVAIYEILYVSDVPSGVAISEAVELSKGYDCAETVSFINGVLGSFSRQGLAEKPDAWVEESESDGTNIQDEFEEIPQEPEFDDQAQSEFIDTEVAYEFTVIELESGVDDKHEEESEQFSAAQALAASDAKADTEFTDTEEI